MPEAVIVDAVRTARGKRNGSFANTHPMDLAAFPLHALASRNVFEPRDIDDVVYGCVTQTGEQGMNIARGAVLAAGWSEDVPGVTVNRFCGSGLQAVNSIATAIIAGVYDGGVGGGVEHMTRVPMGTDALGGDGPQSAQLHERWPDLASQGISAERIVERWKLDRRELDEFAVRSQELAASAREQNRFVQEIAPFEVNLPDGTRHVVEHDEHPRPGTTLERLGTLKPAFKDDGTIHAGNSSGIVDGAAAVLLMSKARARSLRLKPRAKIVSMAIAGSDPLLMLTGPIPATQKALSRADLGVRDIDLFEINEAFAPVPLVVARELDIPLDRVNVNGGAIALGHPLGATGAMLIATLLNELERQDKRRGLVTLCIGYGMGITTIIDRKID